MTKEKENSKEKKYTREDVKNIMVEYNASQSTSNVQFNKYMEKLMLEWFEQNVK